MKKIISVLFIAILFLTAAYSNSKNLVINVTLEQKSYQNLDKSTKALADAAYNQFLHDLTLFPEITIRNSETDTKMREIQKQSQVDAATGMGNEGSVYSADKGSRSDLFINFTLNQIDKDIYQIVCSISEIESMRLITTENTKRLSLIKVTQEATVDEIAYRIILDLEKRGYITSVSSSVKNQLHNNRYAEENFEKQKSDENNYSNSTSDDWMEIGENAFENLNYKVAFESLSKAKNNAKTYYYLGYMYEMGYGTVQNFDKAVFIYEISAEQGYADAQYRLGACYYNGNGVSKDYSKAVSLWQRAAEQGHSFAQNDLGWCYYKGQGIGLDYKTAVYWYEKSVSQGNSFAQCNLGVCYFKGHGVSKDYERAVELYLLSASQNSYYAQYNLGDCYYYGYGVQKDLAKSKGWYQKSADQGYVPAKNALKTKFSSNVNPVKNSSSLFDKQKGRQGAFLNLGYINGSFFQGLEISPSITWGVKNIFWGFDVGFAFPVLKQEYVSSIEANYDYFYLDTLLGGALNIWNFNPYIGAGVGGYYFCASPKKDSKEKEIWVIDMQVEGIVGVDYKFKFFALGITYKLKWLKSLGFADSYGISAGFTW